jgi:ribonucleoside-diphosphate reductase alpha chain
VGVGPNKVLSVPDAVGQAIERYLEEKEGVQEALPFLVPAPQGGTRPQAQRYQGEQASFIGACPECGGGQMAYEEGCMKCHICGYSECG